MEKVKVSVILPVYEPGDGIVRCIESLQNQTLREIEIIFVDDCGKDNAMDLVREAARRDDRIRYLVNPQNMGAGPSRNRGIEAARGEYLSVLDPDDYTTEDFLELLYKKAEETGADIVKGRRLLVDEDGKEIIQATRDNLNERIRKDLDRGRNLCQTFLYEHTTAIYRREWVMESGARYGTSRNSQDVTFLLQVSYGTRKIVFEERAVYYYVSRKSSRTRDLSRKRLESELLAVKEKIESLESLRADEKTAAEYVGNQIPSLLWLQAAWAMDPDRKELAEEFLDRLRAMVLAVPYWYRIAARDQHWNAFLIYGANLTISHYFEKWGDVTTEEYLDAIRRQVDFVLVHPEALEKRRGDLQRAKEMAEKFAQNLEKPEDRDRALQLIRQELGRLPDEGNVSNGAAGEAVLERKVQVSAAAPKVSVIVPICSPGSGIQRCIRSLQRQTLSEIEMIFVDDSGTDSDMNSGTGSDMNSGTGSDMNIGGDRSKTDVMEDVRKAAEQDGRIRILTNEKHLGAGASRNRGIEAARGEYLSFIDPDIYLSDRFLELLYERGHAVRADIVKGENLPAGSDGRPVDGTAGSGGRPVDGTAGSEKKKPENLRIRRGLVSGEQLCFLFTDSHWTAIYRRDWVMECGARYGSSCCGEDTTFLLRVCYGMRGADFSDEAVCYSVRPEEERDIVFSQQRMQGQLLSFREKLDFAVSDIWKHTDAEKNADTQKDAELYRYVDKLILRQLKVHAGCHSRDPQGDTAETFLPELRDTAASLPFAAELGKSSKIVDTFLKYGANITRDPVGKEWNKDNIQDYLDAVGRVVDFISGHPQLGPEYRDILWGSFEQAIIFRGDMSGKPEQPGAMTRKDVHTALRKQADRLPDKKLLTKDFVAMNLYINYGINVFGIRDTSAGKNVKKLLKGIRKIKK